MPQWVDEDDEYSPAPVRRPAAGRVVAAPFPAQYGTSRWEDEDDEPDRGWRDYLATGARVVGGIGGGLVGSAFGPVGTVLGGLAGGSGGEWLAQKIEKDQGGRQDYNAAQIGVQGLINAVPVGKLAQGAGALRSMLVRAGQGVALNVPATELTARAESGNWLSPELQASEDDLKFSALLGGGTGAAFGAVERGIRGLSRRSPSMTRAAYDAKKADLASTPDSRKADYLKYRTDWQDMQNVGGTPLPRPGSNVVYDTSAVPADQIVYGGASTPNKNPKKPGETIAESPTSDTNRLWSWIDEQRGTPTQQTARRTRDEGMGARPGVEQVAARTDVVDRSGEWSPLVQGPIPRDITRGMAGSSRSKPGMYSRASRMPSSVGEIEPLADELLPPRPLGPGNQGTPTSEPTRGMAGASRSNIADGASPGISRWVDEDGPVQPFEVGGATPVDRLQEMFQQADGAARRRGVYQPKPDAPLWAAQAADDVMADGLDLNQWDADMASAIARYRGVGDAPATAAPGPRPRIRVPMGESPATEPFNLRASLERRGLRFPDSPIYEPQPVIPGSAMGDLTPGQLDVPQAPGPFTATDAVGTQGGKVTVETPMPGQELPSTGPGAPLPPSGNPKVPGAIVQLREFLSPMWAKTLEETGSDMSEDLPDLFRRITAYARTPELRRKLMGRERKVAKELFDQGLLPGEDVIPNASVAPEPPFRKGPKAPAELIDPRDAAEREAIQWEAEQVRKPFEPTAGIDWKAKYDEPLGKSRYAELTPDEQREFNRIYHELDNNPYTRGLSVEDQEHGFYKANEQGLADQVRGNSNPNLLPIQPNAPIYHALRQDSGKARSGRAILSSMLTYANGGAPTKVIADVIKTARRMLSGDDRIGPWSGEQLRRALPPSAGDDPIPAAARRVRGKKIEPPAADDGDDFSFGANAKPGSDDAGFVDTRALMPFTGAATGALVGGATDDESPGAGAASGAAWGLLAGLGGNRALLGRRGGRSLPNSTPAPRRPGRPSEALSSFEVLDPETSRVNASGESAASMEAMSRDRGMRARGEQFMVFDRTGQGRPLIGPDAVDYRVQPGETYGRMGPRGFQVLDDAGGRPPRQLADAGFANPELLYPLAGAMVGGVTGPMVEDDPAVGAIGGALTGAAAGMLGSSKGRRSLERMRYANMLSGLAVPKSLMGNVGGLTSAALENPDLAPRLRREIFSPRTLSDAKNAWNQKIVREYMPGDNTGIMTLPGRTMGMFDAATRGILQRAGMSEKDAARYVLMSEPDTTAGQSLQNTVRGNGWGSALARLALPFSRTATNAVERGVERLPFIGGTEGVRALSKPSDALARRRQILGGLSMAAGAGVGTQFAEGGALEDHKWAMPFIAPMAGPYALPMMLGAAGGYAGSTELGEENPDPNAVGNHMVDTAIDMMPFPKEWGVRPSRVLGSLLPYGGAGRMMSPYLPGGADPTALDTTGSFYAPGLSQVPYLNAALLDEKRPSSSRRSSRTRPARAPMAAPASRWVDE